MTPGRIFARSPRTAALLAAVALALSCRHAKAQEVESVPPVDGVPRVIVGGQAFQITLHAPEDRRTSYVISTAKFVAVDSGELDAGETRLSSDLFVGRDDLPLQVILGDRLIRISPPYVPGWYSVLPPLIAILLALVFREVLTALFIGVWFGSLAIAGFNPLIATWRLIDEFAVQALADTDGQTQIVIFSLLLGGMVGIISKNGGTRGIVSAVVNWATTRRRGKLATYFAGLAIFFDDYANTLIIGNAMRPIADRLRISREKLAYLVDSTAAPVAAIVPISTWVGYEISLIGDGLRIAAEQPATSPDVAASLLAVSPLNVFIQTIPLRFYPLLTLWLVLVTSWMNRDFGPMATAEARAASGKGLHRTGAILAADAASEALAPPHHARERWWNAAIPVFVVIAVVLWGLYATGRAAAGADASLMDIFGASDPFGTLLWGSLAGCIAALVLSVGQRILSVQQSVEAMVNGMRAMLIAVLILVLAWSLGSVTEILGTANFLTLGLGGRLPLELLPAIVFVTAAAISFATGTSWGTMAILLPIVIPLTVGMGGVAGFDGGYSILLGTISSVLAGSIFGDHCSPISDTTVLSSMASSCDHVDHVRTQLPYAFTVAAITIPIGDVATAYGLPTWVALALAALALYLIVRRWGREIPEGSTEEVSASLERSREAAPTTPPPEHLA